MEMNHIFCSMTVISYELVKVVLGNYLGTSVGCPVRMVMLLEVKEHAFMERKWIIYLVI
jgi:hypothetical protein